MKKRVLAWILTLALTLSLLPVGALATGETVTVSVTMNTQSIAENVADYELTALPASAEVEVPAGSTIAQVITQWSQDQTVSVVGADVGFVTAIGDFGDIAELGAQVGLDPVPVEFKYAGWTYLLNGNYDNNGIGVTTVSEGDVLAFRYGVYMASGTWEQIDHKFLDAYNAVTSGIAEGNVASEGDFTAQQWTALQSALSGAVAVKEAIDEEAGGLWLNYFAGKKAMLWGPNSPTEKLQDANSKLKRAIEKEPPIPMAVVLKRATVNLPLNQTVQIGASVEPADANQALTYEVLLGSVTVSSDGLVTPTEKAVPERAMIQVKSAEKPTVMAMCTVQLQSVYTPDLTTLADNIATSYQEKSAEWNIISMGVYAKAYGGDIKPTAATRQTYINNAIASLDADAVDDATASKAILGLRAMGIDPTKLTTKRNEAINAVEKLKATTTTSIYNAPYVLMAYQQGTYDTIKETAVCTYVLEQQEENGSWGNSPDTTGILLAALAPYKSKPEVNSAISKAVTYLKGAIAPGGVFGYQGNNNSDSTAMAVLGLSAVGESPATIKNGETSALDGLLSYALADNSGFGYTDNTTLSEFATKDAFWAVIVASKIVNGDKSYKLFDFKSNPKADGIATPDQGGGGGDRPDPPAGEKMNISFTLETHNATWISKHTAAVPEDGTVGDAFRTVLGGKMDFSYVDKNGYISAITRNGTTLAESSQGPNSGWKYRVNNIAPSVPMNEYTLSPEDDLVWYYVTDYTQDTDRDEGSFTKPTPGPEVSGKGEDAVVELNPSTSADKKGQATAQITEKELAAALTAAQKGEAKTLVLAPKIKGTATAITVELPAASVETMGKVDLPLRVETGLASLTLAPQALADFGEKTGKTVSITAKEGADGAIVLELKTGDKRVETLAGGLRVALPAKGATPGTVLMLVDEEGNQTVLRKSVLLDGAMTVLLEGSATVKLVDNAQEFSDLGQGHWAADAVAFASSRELLRGTETGAFDPEASMTRASLMTLLHRLDGVQTEEAPQGQPWYTPAQTWAMERGLSDGSNPEGEMSRQELALLLFRYAEGEAPQAAPTAPDAGEIAPWAADAMGWAVEVGILAGDQNGRLTPQAPASRAQVAAILERFLAVQMQ